MGPKDALDSMTRPETDTERGEIHVEAKPGNHPFLRTQPRAKAEYHALDSTSEMCLVHVHGGPTGLYIGNLG